MDRTLSSHSSTLYCTLNCTLSSHTSTHSSTLYCTLSSHIRHELYELGQLPVVQIMSGNNHLKFLTRLTGTASGGRIPFFGQHGPGQL